MRYRVAVWMTGVVCFAGLGGWSAVVLATVPGPGPLVGGLVLGGLLGALLVVAFLHALEPHGVAARSTSRTSPR
jgi:hypothetical protein